MLVFRKILRTFLMDDPLQYFFIVTIYQPAYIRHWRVATLQSVSIKDFMKYRGVPRILSHILGGAFCENS